LKTITHRTPIAASHNSSLPEIVGDVILHFDAENVVGIVAAINQVLSDNSLRLAMIKKGNNRSSSLSWEECGRETISIYDSTFSKR